MAPSRLSGDWAPGSFSPLQPCPSSSHKVGHISSQSLVLFHIGMQCHKYISSIETDHFILLNLVMYYPGLNGQTFGQMSSCRSFTLCVQCYPCHNIKLAILNVFAKKLSWVGFNGNVTFCNSAERSYVHAGGELYPLYLRQGQLVGSANTKNFCRPHIDECLRRVQGR